ncbi:transposase [Streptomyces sp. NPDC029674]|uniref:transposase n=1 Tax=Streptomyces sp. NPDC029674 TaxID=3365297 RepID=UPI00384CC2A7
MVWDNLNTHVSHTMRRLIAYRLPPYAPEFNPVEGVWSHLKRSLANLTKHSLDQLTALVKTRLKRMQCRPHSSRGSSPRPDSQLLQISSTKGPLCVGSGERCSFRGRARLRFPALRFGPR